MIVLAGSRAGVGHACFMRHIMQPQGFGQLSRYYPSPLDITAKQHSDGIPNQNNYRECFGYARGSTADQNVCKARIDNVAVSCCEQINQQPVRTFPTVVRQHSTLVRLSLILI
jgi:hypothetical protein